MDIARRNFRTKLIVLALIYVGLLVGGSYFGTRISRGFDITIWPHTEPMINTLIVSGILLYIILTAIPFVPGIELGLALIFAFGVKIVPVVYVATIAALLLSFVCGQRVPERWLASVFLWLHLNKAATLVEGMTSLDAASRVDHLLEHAPKRIVPWLLKHRLLTLCALFNLPGSALLGGGGGIAMMAGMSRLMSLPRFLMSAAIAVSPVPLFLMGSAWMSGG
jgi:hypothetical protein